MRKLKIATISFLTLYCSSYLVLSLSGAYTISVTNAQGVKQFIWSPSGMGDSTTSRMAVSLFYFPLYKADRKFWHNQTMNPPEEDRIYEYR